MASNEQEQDGQHSRQTTHGAGSSSVALPENEKSFGKDLLPDEALDALVAPYPFPDYIPSLRLLAGPSIDDFCPEPPIPVDSLVERPLDFASQVAPITPVSPSAFLTIVNSIREAIEQGVHPVMIPKGSSGSYFCRNVRGEVVGVFKPKDEEPYGMFNTLCSHAP